MSKPITHMTVADVSTWLSSIKLDKYVAKFAENFVDGPTLLQLDKAALGELGLSPVEQARVAGAVDVLKAQTQGMNGSRSVPVFI